MIAGDEAIAPPDTVLFRQNREGGVTLDPALPGLKNLHNGLTGQGVFAAPGGSPSTTLVGRCSARSRR
jgi:hypothetical protein